MTNSPERPSSSIENQNQFEKYSLSDLLDTIETKSALVGQATINMSHFALDNRKGMEREAEAAKNWEADIATLKAEVLRRFSELKQKEGGTNE